MFCPRALDTLSPTRAPTWTACSGDKCIKNKATTPSLTDQWTIFSSFCPTIARDFAKLLVDLIFRLTYTTVVALRDIPARNTKTTNTGEHVNRLFHQPRSLGLGSWNSLVIKTSLRRAEPTIREFTQSATLL